MLNFLRFGRPRVHFLHIGKNAGTEIKRYVDHLRPALASRWKVVKHRHETWLRDLPPGEPYFFSIRSPLGRFRSGFYGRKRKSLPRYHREWSEHEALAFGDFEHANDLAEALFRKDDLGRKAWAAMKSPKHTAMNQSDWFTACGQFLRVRPPLVIIRQEHFAEDIASLQRKLGVDPPVVLEADFVASHRTDYAGVPPLSELAVENLRRWYAQDFEFYDLCCDWVARGGNQAS